MLQQHEYFLFVAISLDFPRMLLSLFCLYGRIAVIHVAVLCIYLQISASSVGELDDYLSSLSVEMRVFLNQCSLLLECNLTTDVCERKLNITKIKQNDPTQDVLRIFFISFEAKKMGTGCDPVFLVANTCTLSV